ncbi:MAG: HD domain-containing protein [Candidatus Magasanikbacteria bacterium]|nr:HD domain-containing protein [Candidatus Magasanikbacteria bacterium]
MLIHHSIINFAGRAEALEKITRYASYRPMFYRTDLKIHSRRVLALVQPLLPLAQQIFGLSFDACRTQLLALVHDDPEIITGDVEMGNKLKMTPAELAALKTEELNAIDLLAKRFPKRLGDYSYRALLREAAELKTPEARLMKLTDKFDAFGEALHEIFAGNRRFVTPLINKYGTITLPTDYYRSYLNNFTTAFPEFAELFQQDHPLFTKPVTLDYQSIAARRQSHTPASLNLDTESPHYNWWKKVMLKNENAENLSVQKEWAAP